VLLLLLAQQAAVKVGLLLLVNVHSRGRERCAVCHSADRVVADALLPAAAAAATALLLLHLQQQLCKAVPHLMHCRPLLGVQGPRCL
jgi:hypothetical protein